MSSRSSVSGRSANLEGEGKGEGVGEGVGERVAQLASAAAQLREEWERRMRERVRLSEERSRAYEGRIEQLEMSLKEAEARRGGMTGVRGVDGMGGFDSEKGGRVAEDRRVRDGNGDGGAGTYMDAGEGGEHKEGEENGEDG